MADATRSLTDFFGMLGPRRVADAAAAADTSVTNVAEASYPTKALQKFLASLQTSEGPLLLDLGPVVGSNVTFFGEQLGCRLRVEDVAKDIDRHVKDGTTRAAAGVFRQAVHASSRAPSTASCAGTCSTISIGPPRRRWPRRSRRCCVRTAACLASSARPSTPEAVYTKYVVVDESTLRYRTYPASRPRQRSLLNGDIIKLFKDLRVTDSFLMKSKVREMLFRKPAPRT